MEIVYRFSPEEVRQDLMLIGETFKLGSNPTKTGRGKRLFNTLIQSNGVDEDELNHIIDKAKFVHSHGMKNSVELTLEQVRLIKLLVAYCMEL